MVMRVSYLLHVLLPCLFFSMAGDVQSQSKVDRYLANKDFTWHTDSISKLRLYYPAGSWAGAHAEEVHARILDHYRSTLRFLGMPEYKPVLHIFILGSFEDVKKLTGFAANGNAESKSNLVVCIASETLKSAYSNHEICHVLAMNQFGIPPLWINEGLAVYADDRWWGYPLDGFAKYLIKNGRKVSLQKLMKDLKTMDSRVSYPLIGSFVKFLDVTYGREKFWLIWRGGKRGLTTVTKKDIPTIEREWLNYLQAVDDVEVKSEL